jgi:Family of unknown function (DUF6788)
VSRLSRLRRNRWEILCRIEGIEEMRRGSVVHQYFPVKHLGMKRPERRGPYALYTRKDKGKTRGRRLRRPEEVRRLQEQVENYHAFRALCAELVGVAEQICDEKDKQS